MKTAVAGVRTMLVALLVAVGVAAPPADRRYLALLPRANCDNFDVAAPSHARVSAAGAATPRAASAG
jgi:hypothetical protein